MEMKNLKDRHLAILPSFIVISCLFMASGCSGSSSFKGSSQIGDKAPLQERVEQDPPAEPQPTPTHTAQTADAAGASPVSVPSSSESTSPLENATKTIVVEVATIEKFMPQLTSLNRDFFTFGPHVKINIKIGVKNTREIWADIMMVADETTDAGILTSNAKGTGQFKIYEHPTPIIAIASPLASQGEYTDNDYDVDTLNQPPGDLVKQYIVVGDTLGEDIGISTAAKVVFNPVTITVQ
jgi:hypothetical protein